MLHSIAGKERKKKKKVRIFGHLKNQDVTVHPPYRNLIPRFRAVTPEGW